MKKNLFIALVACIALACTSCKKEKDKPVTGMSFAQTEIDLLTGDKLRLSLKVEPADAKFDMAEVVWTSSDTAKAVVSGNGTITALAVGSCNITAKYGEYTAVCKVNIAEWFDNLKFTGVYFGVKDTAAYGDKLDTIQSADGSSWKVKLVQAVVELYTEGFYINQEGELDGVEQGGIVEAYSPIYWAPGWANGTDGGVIFVLGRWDINAAACDTIAQCLPLGDIDSTLFIDNMKLFLDNLVAGDQATAYQKNLNDAGEKGCVGATMKVFNYHTTDEGYPEDGYYAAYVPDLFFQTGKFIAENDFAASEYMCSISAHVLTAKELAFSDDDEEGDDFFMYGCYWHFDQEAGYSWNDYNIHWGLDHKYDLNPDAFAAKSAPQYIPVKCHDFATTQKILNRIHAIPSEKVAKL